MSTDAERQEAQLKEVPEPDPTTGEAEQDHDDMDLACSPWIGLHYRIEPGRSLHR